jgi:DNA-binding transcriptional MerR regulator/methylmalonyl-CoA mutase cobalamin-binding subunit
MNRESMSETPRHTIRVATRRTGLTAATLRAWERRYGAVRPARSGTERRLYSDADIERLRLMRELAAQGHGVAQIARLPTDELARLAGEERATTAARDAEAAREPGSATPVVVADLAAGRAMLRATERAVAALDAGELHRMLMRSIVELGPVRFLDEVAAPLCRCVGDEWERGSFAVAHEHLASVSLRQALGFLLETLRLPADRAPRLVAATPQGERHEFGAMMAAAIAATAGWSVTFLGADLPAADIAAAVRQTDARVLALSIVSASDLPLLESELRHLRDAVGAEIGIVAGGAGTAACAAALAEIGAQRLDALADLRPALAGSLT